MSEKTDILSETDSPVLTFSSFILTYGCFSVTGVIGTSAAHPTIVCPFSPSCADGYWKAFRRC